MRLEFEPAAQRGTPIDEPAVQQLKALLDQHAVPQGGMSLEMVDGLFSALQVAPRPVAEESLMALIAGADDWPEAGSAGDAARLLGRLWNHIEQRLAIDPDQGKGNFMPLLSFPAGLPDDDAGFREALEKYEFPLGAAWAGGFLHAIQLDQPAWAELEQTYPEVASSLSHLFRLATLEGDRDNPSPDGRERIALMATMPYVLRVLKALQQARR